MYVCSVVVVCVCMCVWCVCVPCRSVSVYDRRVRYCTTKIVGKGSIETKTESRQQDIKPT